jgi:gas vesicle protein
MTKGKALLGVLAGVAAGAALGIIFAPDKGANTRKNLAKKGEDLAGAINDKIESKFEELLDAVRCQGSKKSQQSVDTEQRS